MTRAEESSRADRLWNDYARTRDAATRDAIVHQFERLAYSLANKFARRGTDTEDLVQVAMLGLVKAVDRFDPSTHYRFSTFATPTILGELRRYFRDHSWAVHVPRGMQEFSQQVHRLERELTEHQGRSPTTAELAARLGATEERVREAQSLDSTNRPLSLDGEVELGDSGRPTQLEQCLGEEDAGLARLEDQVSVRQALGSLGDPLRDVIQLRYLDGLSQREVARRKGLSQMQVSRLEKRAMSELRAQFGVH
ncbi:MAG: SigB/SigF/SigG family RNA polymerase sigma factor [Armatimonadetes bacterium]|nr:SigB/SigF/SigG family RNA polymerase sigma factor [Armatimonadota bacterium]